MNARITKQGISMLLICIFCFTTLSHFKALGSAAFIFDYPVNETLDDGIIEYVLKKEDDFVVRWADEGADGYYYYFYDRYTQDMLSEGWIDSPACQLPVYRNTIFQLDVYAFSDGAYSQEPKSCRIVVMQDDEISEEKTEVAINGQTGEVEIDRVNSLLTWGEEGDPAYYRLEIWNETRGMMVLDPTDTLDTQLMIPAGALEQGNTYRVTVGTMPANGDEEHMEWRELRFSVGLESTQTFTPTPTLRATPSPIQDTSLSVEIITDKTAYASDETAVLTIKVTNVSNFTVKNIALENILPDGLMYVDPISSELVAQAELQPNESFSRVLRVKAAPLLDCQCVARAWYVLIVLIAIYNCLNVLVL